MKSWLIGLRYLQRYWFGGELTALAAALVLSMVCLSSINIFIDRVKMGVNQEMASLLGGDVVISSSNPISDKLIDDIKNNYMVNLSAATLMSSMALHNEDMNLVSLKAVNTGYPLRGAIEIMDKIGNSSQVAEGIPQQGNAWVSESLITLLSLKIGDEIEIGNAKFTVSNIIIREPTQSGGFSGFSPTVMINSKDLSSTNLILPGSRVTYRAFISGTPNVIKNIIPWLKLKLSNQERLLDTASSQTTFLANYDLGSKYLNYTLVMTLLLTAVAITLAVRHYCQRQLSSVALMSSLGVLNRTMVSLHIMSLFLLTTLAMGIGCLIGYFVQFIIENLIQSYITLNLSSVRAQPIILTFATGYVLLLGFGMPILYGLKQVKPMDIFSQRLYQSGPISIWAYVIGYVSMISLLYLQGGDWLLAIWLTAAGGVFIGFFREVIRYCIQGIVRLSKGAPQLLRLSISNLQHYRDQSTTQVSAFSLIIGLTLGLWLVGYDIVATWQQQLPQKTPNYFILNLAEKQVEDFKQFCVQNSIELPGLFGNVRGKLSGLNGLPMSEALSARAQGDESLRRSLNLTELTELPRNNVIVAGTWFKTSVNGGMAGISVEHGFAQRLGIKLGDELSFIIRGDEVKGKIVSIREVKWQSFQPNYFVIFQPGAFTGYAKTYITSFYLPKNNIIALKTMVRKFPNLTALDVPQIIEQVKQIIKSLSMIIEYIIYYTSLVSVIVMLLTLQGQMPQRIRDTALWRVYGASSRQVTYTTVIEFMVVAAISALVGSAIGLGSAYFIANWWFNIEYIPNFYYVFSVCGILILVLFICSLFVSSLVNRRSPLRSLVG